MHKILTILAIVATFGMITSTAHEAKGAVTFGFNVNQSLPGQMFTYSGGGNGAALTAEAYVDFTVKFSNDPTVTTFNGALFAFEARQVDSTPIPGIGGVLYFDGDFTYTDIVSGNQIVRGEFTRAHMLLIQGSSSAALSASSEEGVIGGFMDYSPGQAFVDLINILGILPSGHHVYLVPTEDMGFTLTNITPTTNSISGFTANSSHSGNAILNIVPEPTVMALLAIGGLAILKRRKR